MSDRLLSDERQSGFIEFPVEGYTTDRQGLCEAQCDHTERRERTELAAWGWEICEVQHHAGEGLHRVFCSTCTDGMVDALREGKAPTPSGDWPEGDSEEGTLIKRQKCPNCNVPLKPDKVCPICSSFFSFD